MKKNSIVATKRNQIFREKKLTIGMDLGDQFTYYCVLDEAGEVMVEQKLPTTKQAMKRVFSRIPPVEWLWRPGCIPPGSAGSWLSWGMK
jgi:transposase